MPKNGPEWQFYHQKIEISEQNTYCTREFNGTHVILGKSVQDPSGSTIMANFPTLFLFGHIVIGMISCHRYQVMKIPNNHNIRLFQI